MGFVKIMSGSDWNSYGSSSSQAPTGATGTAGTVGAKTSNNGGLMDLLPAGLGTVGGVVGGILGTPADVATGPLGTMGGAAIGGALGQGAGEVIKQLAEGQQLNPGRVAGEAATGGIFGLLPGGDLGMGLLGRLVTRALGGAAVTGAGQAIQNVENQKPITQNVGSSALVGGALTPLVGEIAPKLLGGAFKNLGTDMTARAIQPDVNPHIGATVDQAKAAQTFLEQIPTKASLTLGGADKAVASKLSELNTQVMDALGKNTNVIGHGNLLNIVKGIMQQNLPEFNTADPSMMKLAQPYFSIIDRYLSKEPAQLQSGITDHYIDSTGVKNAIKAMDKVLEQPGGAFYKLKSGQELSFQNMVSLNVRSALNYVLKQSNPDIAPLLDTETKLIQAGNNLFPKTNVRTPNMWNLRAMPIINQLLGAVGSIELGGGRAAYTAGKGLSALGQNPYTNNSLNAVLRMLLNTATSQQAQTSPMNY